LYHLLCETAKSGKSKRNVIIPNLRVYAGTDSEIKRISR
jgi:hypothetical protein